MRFFKLWEYPITFSDPASVYAYQLVSTHQQIMYWVIVIIIVVYFLLSKIILDYSWSSNDVENNLILFFQNLKTNRESYYSAQEGLIIPSRNIQLNINSKPAGIQINFLQVHRSLLSTYNSISSIVDAYTWAKYYFERSAKGKFYMGNAQFYVFGILHKYLVLFLGISRSHYWFTRNVWNVEGNSFFNDAILRYSSSRLFDQFAHLWMVMGESDFILLNSEWQENKILALNLFSYPASAYFFNNTVNHSRFFGRTTRPFRLNENFALPKILQLRYSVIPSLPKLAPKVYNDFIVREAFFDAQDFKHSFRFEIIWATLPTMIIISILIPSLYLLYSSDDALVPVLTFKVLGHQWYWAYEFNNWIQISKEDDLRFVSYEFDSYLIHTDDLEIGQKRLLEVDNRLIVPATVPLRFVVTSGDVLHSWAVPELGIKIDAVPGRLNQVITFIIRPGVYYGQCSELCGVSHGFMPIVVVAQWPEMWFNTMSNSELGSSI